MKLLNRQANEMRTELRNLRDALSVIRQRSRDIRFQIAGLSSRLKTLRTTRVRGFEQSQAVDNIAIERTLDLLPQSVFSEVDIVEYQEEIWQIIGSGKKFSARGRTSWNARDHATIQIARVAVSTTEEPQNEYASVLAHEVGHVVYTKFLSDEERAEWFAISEEASTYLSNYALEDDVEDFAEAFRLFIFSPAILEQKDPKRYSYIKAIDSRMRTIK